MYYYVNGTVAEIDAGLAVIDCSGVGYACATTNYTLSQLKKGAPAKLYTYLNVREDAMELFGFADQSIRRRPQGGVVYPVRRNTAAAGAGGGDRG